jgi:RHS repeat-associated protein
LRPAKTAAGVTSYFTWDTTAGLPLLLAENTTSYIYGPYGLPIQRVDGSGNATFFHHDVQGSTRALTNTSGATVATYSYDPYGNLTGQTGTASTPLLYNGQYMDLETGLQYLRARYYDPQTAQFISVDPWNTVTGSPYGYASQNPLNLSDPLGLCNANPLSGSFWTEGNCVSESPLNPIPYYEREIEAIEAGCSYWEAVKYGLQGAAALTLTTAALLAPLQLAPSALGSASYWLDRFMLEYPGLYLFLVQRAAQAGTGPPVASTVTTFFLNWMEEHLRA